MVEAGAEVVVSVDDPRSGDVLSLLQTHLAFAREVTPPCEVHALDVDGLLTPSVTFFSAREEGNLVGIGAIRELDELHGEIKSMHTAASARGRGVGRAVVNHLLVVARGRGYRRISLETGATPEFAAARALYASAGFAECDPFGEYTDNPNSMCMTRVLD